MVNAMSPSSLAPNSTPELVLVDDDADQVVCDGGLGPLGHPTVYYSFDGKDAVECLYCDRLFVKRSADWGSMRGGD